jgi:hypothetical protein
VIQTSTTTWLTADETAATLDWAAEDGIKRAEKGIFPGSWRSADGWLFDAEVVEDWRAASEIARTRNAAGDLTPARVAGRSFETLLAENEDMFWRHEWLTAEVAAGILGVERSTIEQVSFPRAQELPDGTWRFDDLMIERRRRSLVKAGDPAASRDAIDHGFTGDGHFVG